jgi:DNA-binding NarL/FixJ family response regulator
MIKVLIADDHQMMREGLKQILSDTEDIIPLNEAKDGLDVLRKVEDDSFDVILLDISMPGMNGLDVLKQLKITKPELNVLILSMHPEEQYAVRLLKAGAAGYLNKDEAPDELIKAIRVVSRGRKYIGPSLAERLAVMIEEGVEKPPHERLTDRELQVVTLIAQGKMNKEIADELKLSPKTTSTYRSRALKKMNMKSNAEIMHYALLNGLINN